MKLLKRLVCGVILITAAAVFMGQASAPSAPRVGIVELEEAVANSKRGKDIINSLEKQIKDKETQLDAEKQEIENLESEYKAKETIWDEMTRKQKQSEIDLKKQALRRNVRDYQEYFAKKQFTELQPIVKDFRDMVEKLGKEKNYDVIFDISGAVLYVNESNKITQEIINYADSVYQ